MKKIIISFIITIISIITAVTYVNAYQNTYTLEFQVIEEKEAFDLYLLLPKEYVVYAISESNLSLTYEGPTTLKENEIPGIKVEKENVMDDIYEENGKEYIQILLEKNTEGKYEFDILSDYPNMDMKYRVKNLEKDFILHIDNFKVKNGICKIEYNYDKDTVKQPSENAITFSTKLLIIVLITIVIIGLIAYIKQRR